MLVTYLFLKTPLFVSILIEGSVAAILIWTALILNKTKTKRSLLTRKEKAALLEKYSPEPLVTETIENHPSLSPKLVTGLVGKRIIINGYDCLNLASHNYLGLLGDEEINNNAISCLRKYGVGSCGPRGFYGTVDVHLELEERLAKFTETEEAVVYSYAFSTIASAIPAYSKRRDVIFADEEVNFAIQKGIDASRSKVFYFKHNDLDDLERLLKLQEENDLKNPEKSAKIKKFIVCEGIYLNTGEMCPLPGLIELRKKYKIRMFLDESVSFGTLGKFGRGLTEHFNVEKNEVDLISGSLEWAVGSVGGFCVGSSYIVEHQRLSGLGYCFSASLPPLLTQAAICAINKFESNPEIFEELQNTSRHVHETLIKLNKVTLRGHPLSPIKHIYIKDEKSKEIESELLTKIVDACMERNLGLVSAPYLDSIEKKCPRPSIRLAISRLLTNTDIEFAFNILNEITENIL